MKRQLAVENIIDYIYKYLFKHIFDEIYTCVNVNNISIIGILP